MPFKTTAALSTAATKLQRDYDALINDGWSHEAAVVQLSRRIDNVAKAIGIAWGDKATSLKIEHQRTR